MTKEASINRVLILIIVVLTVVIAAISLDPIAFGRTSPLSLSNRPARFTRLEVSDHLSGEKTSANQKIITTTSGSGVNGPKTAHIGLSIFLKKDSWWRGGNVGEIDGQYITVRQGGLGSDSSGQLIDIQRSSASTGFLSATESSTSFVDTESNQTMYDIDVQTGVLNNSKGQMGDKIGLVLNANRGLMTSALRLQDDAVGAWGYFVQAYKHRIPTWVVTDNGDIQAASSFRIGISGTAPFYVNRSGKIFANAIQLSGLGNYLNDSEAQAAGIPIGGLYRSGSAVQIRVH